MKRLLMLVALLCAATLGSSSAPSVMSAPGASTKEKATMRFDQTVMLKGVALKGTYLFVHDDKAMAGSDACTYVYEGVAELQSKLVVSFHCQPKNRIKVGHFTVRTIRTPAGLDELTEFQFSGSTEAHLVPVLVK